LKHTRSINNSPVFSDETLHHLLPSNSSSLATVKMIHDQYERLFLRQSRIYELTEEFFDAKDKENLENKRKLILYQVTLHNRGLIEEFRGYLQDFIQPNSTTPISIKNFYKKMIDMTFN